MGDSREGDQYKFLKKSVSDMHQVLLIEAELSCSKIRPERKDIASSSNDNTPKPLQIKMFSGTLDTVFLRN